MTVAVGTANQLIVFAGPHKAASKAVEQFFYKYASGHSRLDQDGNLIPNGERKKTFGLRYWKWPRISGKAAEKAEKNYPYKIYNHLVTQHFNDVLRNEIHDGIRKAWESNGIEGIIIGSVEFDQVGPEVEFDASKAVKGVVDFLDLHPNQVTVVLNYRTPRLDQWASMWKHDSSIKLKNAYKAEYEEWLCDGDRMEEHVRVLATEMNPLNAAEAYVNLGYNVKLVDMEGVDLAGRDVVHVIACDIATAKCDDGAVRDHEEDMVVNSIATEFSALTESQRVEAEALFRYRDCAYKDLRENVKFGVLYNHSIWATCEDEKFKTYQQLREDPSYMYRALVDQVKCPKKTGHPLPKSQRQSMKDALNGKKSKSSDGGIGSILFEFVVFAGIFAGVMGYQYHRMIKSGPLPVGAHSVAAAAPVGSLKEEEGQFANDMDAEFGDADSDEDDNLPSTYRD